jgi:para-aminobenzoate synthetase component I
MRKVHQISFSDDLPSKLEQYFHGQPFCLLNSNHHAEEFTMLIGAGEAESITCDGSGSSFELFEKFHAASKDWLLGFFSYDLKNEIEVLYSKNPAHTDFPELYFFCPKFLFLIKEKKCEVQTHKSVSEVEQNNLIEFLKQPLIKEVSQASIGNINPRMSREKYIDKVQKIKTHIQLGDIYEMNFCQEFRAENVELDPYQVYEKLNEISPMPFATYFHCQNNYLMCASPERYLKKKGGTIISQPIKGTIKRGINAEEDNLLKAKLFNDPKEQSENVMIVDLVRNDLSRTAKRGSVNVKELFGIYTFSHVHHMISTITSELKPQTTLTELIKTTFPMGSMTGAPKIRAMEIIEEFEETRRGLFSGAVGYITPEGDFDFNVVIRSLFYNEKNRALTFLTGSAITIHSEPQKEYEECMLKAKAIFTLLNQNFQENPMA